MIEGRLEDMAGMCWQDVLTVLESMAIGDIEACFESGDLDIVLQRASEGNC